MPCPLTSSETRTTLAALPATFDTLGFVVACPRSGGTSAGTGCSEVRAKGGRSVCGRGLAAFAQAHPDALRKVGAGSPATWASGGCEREVTPPAEHVTASRSALVPRESAWVAAEKRRQVTWKRRVAMVEARGLHDGVPVDYLFPREAWSLNLLPEERSFIVDQLRALDIEPHDYAHHVLSSQVFALNLAAPFFRRPHLLQPVLQALLPAKRRIASVDRVEAEVVDPKNRFREPGKRGVMRTSADLGIWWTTVDGERCLLLVEVKYTEAEFGGCTKGRDTGGLCDSGGRDVVASGGALCPLTLAPHRRTYWTLLSELNIFNAEALSTTRSCPFRHDGYQLMRNQVLAATLERDADLDRADFAVMMHDDNATVRTLDNALGGTTDSVQGWRSLLADPSRFHVLSPKRWLEVAGQQDGLRSWAEAMLDRYFAPRALTQGHWAALRWFGSLAFERVKAVYDEACGPGSVYFRVVDDGLVTIGLHRLAPGYVGHRTNHGDQGHLLRPGGTPPGVDAVRARHKAFEEWLPSVNRVSLEEQAIIPWLRRALADQLWLPELGPGWVFLNQEWRFVDDAAKGKKADVLAVHLPTGTLGIVEAKSRLDQRAEAALQVRDYQRFWTRDGVELAPFFTELTQAMGRLYGNAQAAQCAVSTAPSVAFFAAPDGNRLVVEPL